MEWGRARPSAKFLLVSMCPFQRFSPLFVPVTIVTRNTNEGKSKTLELSPEQEVKGNPPIGTPVLGTAV